MSFSGTPLGQGRRLDHHTFLNKPNPNAHLVLPRIPNSPPKDRPVPSSYAYGAPTLGKRSPPKTGSSSTSQEDSALARFARLKQRQQASTTSSSSSQTQTQTKTLDPTKWAVKDTSVQVANALREAAASANPLVNSSYPSQYQSFSTDGNSTSSSSMNPNDTWASQSSRTNVPRSTSVEFEQQAATLGGRRFAEPPRRNGPPPARSSGAATRQVTSNGTTLVNDGDNDEEQRRTRNPSARGKSPLIETALEMAKRAAFYMRPRATAQDELENSPPQDQSYTNGHNHQDSYSYETEEREYAREKAEMEAQKSNAQRKGNPLGAGPHKRGRISIDNKAYKPSVSDYDDSDEDLSDDTKKRRKKKKKDLSGLSLPVMPGTKRRKRKSRGSGEMAGSDEDGGSESDNSPSVHSQPSTQIVQQQQSNQRASLTRSIPPPSRASASRNSIPPPEPFTQPATDYSLEQTEEGQQSLGTVPEDDYEEDSEPPLVQTRPTHPYARVGGDGAFSIGGLLGKLVHIVLTTFSWALAEFFRVAGKVVGMTLKPIAAVSDSRKSAPIIKGAGVVLLLATLLGLWSVLPSASNWVPQSSKSHGPYPGYTAPELPAADIAEISQRLLSLENALAGLSLESERTRATGSNKHNELLGRLGQLETQVQKENRRAIEAESQYSSSAAQNLQTLRREIEVLQHALQSGEYTQEKTTVIEKIIESAGPASDEEARAKLAALEERINGVEGGVKEALEVGKNAVKVGGAAAGGAATWWRSTSSSAHKGLSIKSADGQDVTALIGHMVDSAVSRRGRDWIAKPDFALNSGGANVIPALTSDTLEVKPEGLKALLGLVTGQGSGVIGRPPVTALHHENHNGHCWPFAGAEGHLGVQLAYPAYIEEVSVDHVAREVAWDLRSAPREMELWGLIEGKDNFEKVRQWKVAKTVGRMQREAEDADEALSEVTLDEEEDYPQFLPRNAMWIRIASFEYDVKRDEEVQTFPVDEEVKALGIDFGVVVLSIKNNWGREFTCLYRLRVHGQRMMDALEGTETSEEAPEPEPTQAP